MNTHAVRLPSIYLIKSAYLLASVFWWTLTLVQAKGCDRAQLSGPVEC